MSWYKKLKIKENPFTIKPNQNLENYIGNQDQIKNILRLVNEKKLIIIKGEYGTGKTTILKSIINEFKGQKKLFYQNAFYSNEINPKKISIEAGNFFSRTLNIETKDIILLIDEAHALSDGAFEQITKEFKKTFKAIILATSKTDYVFPQKIQLLKTKEFLLEKFTKENAKEIVKTRLNGSHQVLPENVIEVIYDQSKTSREFLQKCDDACRNAIEKGKTKVSVKDV
jgi:replication-associated recombination protein RarA